MLTPESIKKLGLRPGNEALMLEALDLYQRAEALAIERSPAYAASVERAAGFRARADDAVGAQP